jgi:prepilin signal peptidase PulO-like enzyme (type II secretory pathway)
VINTPLLIVMTAGATALLSFPLLLRLGIQSLRRWITPTDAAALLRQTQVWWLGALLLAVVLSWHGASAISDHAPSNRSGLSTFALAGLIGIWAALLAALSRIDIKTRLLPDTLTVLMLLLGLFFHSISTSLAISDALIGAVAGYASLFLVGQAFVILRGQEAIGRGDVAMLAGIGAWIGWQLLPLALLVACLVSLAVTAVQRPMATNTGRLRFLRHEIPFGPWLAIGAVAAWVMGAQS